MKSVLLCLSLLLGAAMAEVQFMLIPSPEAYELLQNETCSDGVDVEVEALISLYATQCVLEVIPTQTSQIVSLGDSQEYHTRVHTRQYTEDSTSISTSSVSTSTSTNTRSRSGGRKTRHNHHRHLAIDCINLCWSKKKNAPPICCLLCSWCVGSASGNRRELASTNAFEQSLDGEVDLGKHLTTVLECMESKFQEKCEEGGLSPCAGCSEDGVFEGAVSGFITLSTEK